MKDWEEALNSVFKKLEGLEKKIEAKFDGIDEAINEKLKPYVFAFKTGDSRGSTPENGEKGGAKSEKTRDKKEWNDTVNDFGKNIEKMLCYLDDDALHELVIAFTDGDLEIDMSIVLPYLDESEISSLMTRIQENGGQPFKGLCLEQLLPFADEEEIGEIFKARVKEGYIDEKLVPFVDDDCLHEIVVDYCNDENSKINIDELYPFLDDEEISLLFKTYLKRQKKK